MAVDLGLAASMDHFISFLERILSSLHPLETARSQFPSRDSSLVSFGLVYHHLISFFRLYIHGSISGTGHILIQRLGDGATDGLL